MSPRDVVGLADLLARVEKAAGPDRELDFAIHIELVDDEIWPVRDRLGRVTNPNYRMSDYLALYRDVISADDQDFTFSRYTASLDAALALCERATGSKDGPHALDLLELAIDNMCLRGWRPNQPNGPQIARSLIIELLREQVVLAQAEADTPDPHPNPQEASK